MKKEYRTPEIKSVKFDVEDIIQTSGDQVTNSLPKSFDGAEQVSNQDFVSVFE